MLDVLSRTVTRVRLPGAAAAVGTDHAHAPHRMELLRCPCTVMFATLVYTIFCSDLANTSHLVNFCCLFTCVSCALFTF